MVQRRRATHACMQGCEHEHACRRALGPHRAHAMPCMHNARRPAACTPFSLSKTAFVALHHPPSRVHAPAAACSAGAARRTHGHARAHARTHVHAHLDTRARLLPRLARRALRAALRQLHVARGHRPLARTRLDGAPAGAGRQAGGAKGWGGGGRGQGYPSCHMVTRRSLLCMQPATTSLRKGGEGGGGGGAIS